MVILVLAGEEVVCREGFWRRVEAEFVLSVRECEVVAGEAETLETTEETVERSTRVWG